MVKEAKIVNAIVEDGGKYITIKLSGVEEDYTYIFLDANDLPDLAEISENM